MNNKYINIAYQWIQPVGTPSRERDIEIPFNHYWQFGLEDAATCRLWLRAHARGLELAKMLRLTPNRKGRYDLAFGDYTAIGLYQCIRRCMREGYIDLKVRTIGLGDTR